MNYVVEEMKAIMENDDDFVIKHYGVKRRSGRYPWGSGKEPYQRGMDFLARYEGLRKLGKTDVEIARELNMLNEKGEPSTGILRLEKKYCNDMRQIDRIMTAQRLRDKEGLGPTAIGRKMGLNESTVRSLLDPNVEARARLAANTADFLRKQVDEKKMLDITSGTEHRLTAEMELNISRERMKEAVYILQKEGYVVYSGGIPQPTNKGQQTTQKVLCVPGTKHNEIYDYERVKTIDEFTSRDGGNTFEKMVYPSSLDSKRLKVLLADEVGPDGEKGIDKDGIIQIRRGVPDLSLGSDRYAQVRILVDNKKYLKGMAVYSDNMPDGIDVIFNSNKTSYEKALKDIKTDDPINPFGSAIKPNGQSYYDDPNGTHIDPLTGKRQSLSLINKRASEGDWTDWTDALPSQFLSKQPLPLAKKQLALARADKQAEFDAIMELSNPTIKKYYLDKFAESCDSDAVHLKAAALPGQKYHVMIPVNTLKDNEIYAPRYDNGTQLALIRYPHAGRFEIPILTVNNKHAAAKKLIGPDSIDAVGLNKNNAERLSGADFDGDTVMCIPTHDPQGRVKIANADRLEGLKDFDHLMLYAERPGMKYMKDPVTGKDSTQKEMGVISNLISDMTLQGAGSEDMAKAVRHSMVVIDAAKHKLDYKRSEVENEISRLKKEWQVNINDDGTIKYGGASTIVSRAKGEATVNKRQGTPKVNIPGKSWYDPSKPEGSLIYKDADDLYYPDRQYSKDTGLTTVKLAERGKKVVYDAKDPAQREKYDPIKVTDPDGTVRYTNKAGDIEYRVKKKTQPSTNMAETDDAHTLVNKVNPHPMEILYADHANAMKAMANEARKASVATRETAYSAEAKRVYQPQVDSLMSKLRNAELNSIKERAALRKANVEIDAIKLANPDLKKADLKKINQRAVTSARAEVGSVKRADRNIVITDKEWEAIQAGAISKTKLTRILNNTDADALRERAMPRSINTLSKSQITRAKSLAKKGYSMAEIASKFGVSTSTINNYLKGEK